MKRYALPLALMAALPASTALAQAVADANQMNSVSMIEEIIVTAQKREQSLSDVPVSVAVVDGSQITNNGIVNLDELSASVPNLSIAQSSGTTFIMVRGLGSGDDFGIEQSVGMFIDGIYAGRSRQFRAPLFDINSVEILKGPQGSLFGKNTIAGAINVTSARPTDQLEASALLRYEPDADQRTVEGIISGPISETLLGRLAVKDSVSDGSTENTLKGSNDTEKDESVIRGSLLWTPTDDIEVLTKLEVSRFDTAGSDIRLQTRPAGDATFTPLYQAADPQYHEEEFRRSAGPNDRSETSADNLSIAVDWSLGEHTLTSITGYSRYKYDESQDVDFGPIPLLNRQIIEDFEQYSQEIRLTSPLGERFDYIAGLYYQTSELENRANVDLAPGELPVYTGLPSLRRTVDYNRESDSVALFGNASWHFTERLHLNMGLRYTREEVDANRSLVMNQFGLNEPMSPALLGLSTGLPAPFDTVRGIFNTAFGAYEHSLSDSRSVENWSPTVKFYADVTDDLMLYSSISKSFKSGGFNASETVGNADTFEFADEEALAYEIGGKLSTLDGQAFITFAAFYTDFDDLQVSSFIGDSYVVGNAASAVSKGFEIDSRWNLAHGFSLNAAAAYLDASYSDYQNGPCPYDMPANTPSGCRQDLSDRPISLAPEWTANISVNHDWEMDGGIILASQLEASYVDERYLSSDLDESLKQPDYTLINGRVALSSDEGWEVALIGKNLTNKEVAFLGNDAPLQDGVNALYLNTPRTVAVQVKYSYQ